MACTVAICQGSKNVCDVKKKAANCGLVPKKGLRSHLHKAA